MTEAGRRAERQDAAAIGSGKQPDRPRSADRVRNRTRGRWQRRALAANFTANFAAILTVILTGALALGFSAPAAAEVTLPAPDTADGVTVRAREAWRWTQGEYRVWRLRGGVSIAQGGHVWRGADAAIWVDEPRDFDTPTKLIALVEAGGGEPVRIELRGPPRPIKDTNGADETNRANDSSPKTNRAEQANEPDASGAVLARQQAPHWFGRLRTTGGVRWETPEPLPEPAEKPGVFARGLAKLGVGDARLDAAAGWEADSPDNERRFDPAVRPTQFLGVPTVPPPTVGTPFPGDPFQPVTPSAPGGASRTPNFRSLQVFPRQGVGLQARVLPSDSGESIAVLSGGVRLVIAGLESPGLPGGATGGRDGVIDQIELEADRAVVWTSGGGGVLGGRLDQSGDTPLEIYLEGNLEFRQGERVIYAQRMFYDARRQTGVVLDAELLTPLPELDGYQYRGLVRLKADAIRQLEDSRYVAENALFTTSRLEEPTYSLRADRITLEDYRRPLIDPLTGEPAANPFTGTALEEREQNAASEGNRVYFGDVPIFYWPRFETDLREPTFYIDGFRVRNDAIFGFQVLTDWDVYQLLGSKAPAGTDWTVGLDYLSERGLGYGTTYQYEVDRFAGADGPASGRTDLWFISDNDTDNLGFGRRDIDPEASFRGRAFWDHKQSVRTGVLAGWETQAQVGWISDRTFLEQYYEQEWDAGADQATGFRLRRRIDNQSLSIEANAKLNDFFTESQWLPRVDHWLMGSDLGTGAVTWFAHTHAGYANLNPATPPIDAGLAAQYALFPWEAPVEGERFATRQEIDLPIDLEPYGLPAKVVPFILGEFAHWGDTLAGGDLQRAYVHTGVRASAPFWKVNPDVRDPVFNLDGLAHKVVFDAEASYADSSRNLTDLPLYDEIEDNSLEEIRRRLFFPGVPEAQDPRFYLVRTGIQGWVGAPTTEVVEDLSVARVGMRHRLQTKRGAPGQQRIVDWLTIDTNASLFPESDENNLGETLGLVDYDLAWHLGDRFTVLSDGFVDLFTDGLQTFSAGIAANRPSRGNAYIGYRSIRGPFNSDLVSLRLAYRMGPKWVGEAATVIDFGEAGNIGQSFSLSRIGESLIFTVGATVDESKDNTGLRFLVEPRFLPSTTLTRRTGIDIPPAGAFGLE